LRELHGHLQITLTSDGSVIEFSLLERILKDSADLNGFT